MQKQKNTKGNISQGKKKCRRGKFGLKVVNIKKKMERRGKWGGAWKDSKNPGDAREWDAEKRGKGPGN